MATATATPNVTGNEVGGVSPDQSAPSAQTVTQIMEKFRPLADEIKKFGVAYPEGQKHAVSMMQELQGWMAEVAGNSQRVPEAMAPPNP